MEKDINNMNTTALAYLGDAVYELKIREMLVRTMKPDASKLHHEAIRYVSSAGQAKAVKEMMKGFLTEEEQKLVKRARNRRSTSRPRNADPKNYKLATGFEALLGFLYIDGRKERLEEVMDEAVRIVEEEE
jgi:ribonuclease-3 family protein